jgi:hypothetical protein
MNIIAIDPSITSTGMCINGELFSYSYNSAAFTKKGNLTKWYESSEKYVNFRFHDKVSFGDYEEEQIEKIKLYRKVVDKIIEDISDNINTGEETVVAIEGYSYGSSAGNLIDLVSFGTLIRDKIIDNFTDNIKIVSPSTLKLESCKMVYEPIKKIKGIKKKKVVYEYRNKFGIAGGNFTKKDMYNAIIESKWNDQWAEYLKTIKGEFKAVPKPHEDLNDAYLMYQYLLKN